MKKIIFKVIAGIVFTTIALIAKADTTFIVNVVSIDSATTIPNTLTLENAVNWANQKNGRDTIIINTTQIDTIHLLLDVITIHDSLVIIGNGVVISNQNRPIFSSFGIVEIRDIIFTNNTVVSNFFTLNGIAAAVGDFGNKTKFINCKFINNKGVKAGVVSVTNDNASFVAEVTFDNCEFEKNTTWRHLNESSGGAIYCTTASSSTRGNLINIKNCTFKNNKVRDFGGAIFMGSYHELTVENSSFIGNASKQNGGAITIGRGGKINVKKTTFINNISDSTTTVSGVSVGLGGAIYLDQDSKCIADSCQFAKNTALYGGGIYAIRFGKIVITNSSMRQDTAKQNGGAFFVGKDVSVTLNNSKINTNYAKTSGAAIYTELVDTITIINCQIDSNKAIGDGGAIFLSVGAIFNINQSQMNANFGKFGGCIASEALCQINVKNTTFQYNKAISRGAAIYALSTNTTSIDSSNFSFNTIDPVNGGASGSFIGGAIYNNAICEVNNSTFYKNILVMPSSTGSLGGGGIYTGQKGTTTIRNCIFEENEAFAGAALNSKGILYVYDTKFKKNKARELGAIFNHGKARAYFWRCDMEYNTSQGAVSVLVNGIKDDPYAVVKMTDCNIINNGDSTNYSVIENYRSMYLNGCNFENNRSKSSSFYLQDTTNFYYTRFVGNTVSDTPPSSGAIIKFYHGIIENNEDANILLANCVLSGNKAIPVVSNTNSGNITLLQTTIANNNSPAIRTDRGILSPYNKLVIQNSIIWGNAGGIDTFGTTVVANSAIDSLAFNPSTSQITNLFSQTPIFIDPKPFTAAPTSQGNYRLNPCSYLLDKGDNSLLIPQIGIFDLDSRKRVIRGLDIGAYEYEFPKLILQTDTVICNDRTAPIMALGTLPNTYIQWFKDDNLLVGDTLPVYQAATQGEYSYKIVCPTYNESSEVIDSVMIIDKSIALGSQLLATPDGKDICGGDTIRATVNQVPNLNNVWYLDTMTTPIYVGDTLLATKGGMYRHALRNNFGCKTFTDTVFITENNGKYIFIPTQPYFQNFENSTGAWQPEIADFEMGVDTIKWNWENFKSKISGQTTNNTKVFVTKIPNTPNYNQDPHFWVVSPCIDFSAAKYPMIAFDYWLEAIDQADGAVLQYTTNGRTWKTLGAKSELGINWYNANRIVSKPGQQQGDTLRYGWTGFDNEWKEARHQLNELAGKPSVRFRMAYSKSFGLGYYTGFAFDNIWIGERNKKVLFEHFISQNNTTEIQRLNGQYRVFPNHIIPINYLVRDSAAFVVKPHVEARALFYNIDASLNNKGYSVLDGGKIYTDSTIDINGKLNWTLATVANALLTHAPFDIDATLTFTNAGNNHKVLVVANVELADSNLLRIHPDMQQHVQTAFAHNDFRVHVVLVKDSIVTSNGLSIPNVFRAALPHVGGTPLTATQQTFSVDWSIPSGELADTALFSAVVFVQNRQTGDVFQVATTRPQLAVATQPALPSANLRLTVFPNPTHGNLEVGLPKAADADTRWQLYNLQGATVAAGALPSGNDQHRLSLPHLPAGMYILAVMDKKGLVGREKVMILQP